MKLQRELQRENNRNQKINLLALGEHTDSSTQRHSGRSLYIVDVYYYFLELAYLNYAFI